MKKILSIGCFMLVLQFLASAKGVLPIPDAVATYVKSHFPQAKNIHWQKNGSNYIAHFVNVKSEVSLYLDEKGELLDRITEITMKNEIPDAVKRNYKPEQLAYAEKFEGRNGEVFYILEIKTVHDVVEEMIFDKEGNKVNEIVFDEATFGKEDRD